MKEYDAFISHASEDKRYFVRPLCQKLSEYGAKVWYDEFSMKAGMSLSRSIEKGISNSHYGIVVLSKKFFSKQWTEYELKALNSFEIENPGLIIPIWYKVSREDVKNFSPYLVDKLAITPEKATIAEVAIKILEVIREDLFEELHQKQVWEDILKTSTKKLLDRTEFEKIKFGPIRHETFPIDIITRIRLIRASLFNVYPHSMKYWVEGFQRDMHPEDEINKWERISCSFKEAVYVIRPKDNDEQREIFNAVFAYHYSNHIDMNKTKLNAYSVNIIKSICKHIIPTYDIKDKKFGE